MRFDAERNGARLELRVLELEDSVAAMARVIGTMAEMLSRLNEIAAHYADTVGTMLPLALPPRDRPPAVTLLAADPGAGRCGGGCPCSAD